jgi:hypothetical protein
VEERRQSMVERWRKVEERAASILWHVAWEELLVRQ